jgi:hypothetical protein
MVQKSRKDMPLHRRFLTGKYFLLASLLNQAIEHPQVTNVFLLDGFLHAKVVIFYNYEYLLSEIGILGTIEYNFSKII